MNSDSEAAKAWSTLSISDIYEKTRPHYNLDGVEFLLEKMGALKPHRGPEPFTIVELGAGTGKFTRDVLKVFEKQAVRNFKIIATEPLQAMCEKFKEMVPDVEILQCAASDMNDVKTSSVDCILAAQSFHWFYRDQKAINEIHRVLKTHGMFGVIWNVPDRSVSWIKYIFEEMIDPRLEAVAGITVYDEKVFRLVQEHGRFGNEGSDLDNYPSFQEFSLTDVIDRCKGISIIAIAQGAEKELMLKAIEQELKTNPDTKDKEKYIFKYVSRIFWFQKM